MTTWIATDRLSNPLAEEFDVLEVALAAVKLAYEATGAATDDEDIPDVGPRDREDRPARGKAAGPGQRRGRPASDGVTRLYIGSGRAAGVRPPDLVGAIANESRLSGKEIGAIQIADRFSLVEVPESAADDVIAALKGASIKGRKATVRRERYPAR